MYGLTITADRSRWASKYRTVVFDEHGVVKEILLLTQAQIDELDAKLDAEGRGWYLETEDEL